jgi:hypothetical protein
MSKKNKNRRLAKASVISSDGLNTRPLISHTNTSMVSVRRMQKPGTKGILDYCRHNLITFAKKEARGKRKYDVRSYIRKGKRVRAYSAFRLFGKKKKENKNNTASNLLKIAGAGVATTILFKKGIKRRWDKSIIKSSLAVEEKADNLVRDITKYLDDPIEFRKLKRAAQEELIKKGRKTDPLAPLDNPDIVKRYNFVSKIQDAQKKSQSSFSFVLGGMDGGQGLTGPLMAGNMNLRLPAGRYRRKNLEGKSFFSVEDPTTTAYGHIWTQTQNRIIVPRSSYSMRIPFFNKGLKIPGTPVGVPINRVEQQLDALKAVFVKSRFFGVDPDGEELAYYALAARKLLPKNTEIRFIGQCAGGFHTTYAASVLNKLNMRVKTFNIATPNFVPHNLDTSQLKTIISKHDSFYRLKSKKDTPIDDVWGHAYFGKIPKKDKKKASTGYENSLAMVREYRRFFGE